MSVQEAGRTKRCARCGGALPAPDDVLVIVHPSNGTVVETCSAACMAAWIEDWPKKFRPRGGSA